MTMGKKVGVKGEGVKYKKNKKIKRACIEVYNSIYIYIYILYYYYSLLFTPSLICFFFLSFPFLCVYNPREEYEFVVRSVKPYWRMKLAESRRFSILRWDASRKKGWRTENKCEKNKYFCRIWRKSDEKQGE